MLTQTRDNQTEEFALEELEKLVTSLLKEPDASSKDFKAATVALKATGFLARFLKFEV